MSPQLIRERREHIVMGLIWQVIRIYIFRNINLRYVPEIVLLKKEEEEPNTMYKLKPEEVLLRWMNYYLAKDGNKRVVKNFGKDVADGEAYGHVFKHICNDWKEDYWGLNSQQRAERILEHCKQMHITPYIKSQDITSGNTRLNLLFSAQVFNSHHGLKFQEEKKPEPIPIPEPVETD
jgi:plastin-1